MSYRLEPEVSLRVVGIRTRASNAAPEQIGDLWQRFHSEQVAASIAGRMDGNTYSVYSNYESNASGSFDVLIGCAVSDEGELPEGFAEVVLAGAMYAVFAASEATPAGIGRAWAEVWATPLQRAYQGDFEQYQPDGTITVHVGVL